MGGVIGIDGSLKAAELAHVGLFSVQHRGQESCGITVYNQEEKQLYTHTSSGLVMSGFSEKVLAHMTGHSAIGHVRYPTSGVKFGDRDAQPFMFRASFGDIAIALSGNIINVEGLIKKLKNAGAILQHHSETELIVHLIAQQKLPFEAALKKTLAQIEGGYAAVMLYDGKLAAFRDARGFRPLVLGKAGKTFIVASETPAIEIMGGKYLRDVEPGEMLIIEKGKVRSSFFTAHKTQHNCIFEQVYLARPDAVIRGQSVARARIEMGKALARQMKGVKADIVMPVPDSGFFAALGYAQESGLPFEMGLVRNHYMGRSFIKSTQNIREMVVKLKLLPILDIVKGKNVVLVDDSIVRGTTAKKLIKVLRDHGAKKVHFALTSPPIIAPCFYGINTPNKSELIAANYTHKEIEREIGVDSITFITKENAAKACGGIEGPGGYCSACFTGKYPTKISKRTMESR